MSWKIETISIENFKFFENSFEFPVKGKNVLLFGENGSGKSSIYWSVYTLFQSSLKSREQAQKYFQHHHKETLRNKFSHPTDYSGIKVSFRDENGTLLSFEDSNSSVSVDNPLSRQFLSDTMASSDFMNYKFLSAIFDFRNSEENNVFKIFEKEIFPFLRLNKQLITVEGNATGFRDVESWWRYLNQAIDGLPKNAKNKNSFNQNSQEYKKYKDLLAVFNDEIRKCLGLFELSANRILRVTFGIDAALSIKYYPSFFNRIKPGTKKSHDGKLTCPKIILHAEMIHPDIAQHDEIQHPRSFFNEAKLTCMAFALRLAVLNNKPSSGPGYCSVLFVDDLLISLDMSFRRKVLQVLLDSSGGRQSFIFTHDRSFYHLVKGELERRKCSKDWLFYELYSDKSNNHPKAILLQPSSPLEEAKVFLSELRIPSCANAIRRACEHELRRLLPTNYQFKEDPFDLHSTPLLDLNGLIGRFEQLRTSTGLPEILPGLSTDRKLIMNPFSHDDIDTPFYRNELSRLITGIEELSKVSLEIIVEEKSIGHDEFLISLSNGSFLAEARFTMQERMLKFIYQGISYFSKPKVSIVSSTASRLCIGREYSLTKVFTVLYNSISLNASTAPTLQSCLFKADGRSLLI